MTPFTAAHLRLQLLLAFAQFFRSREIAEGYVDFAFADRDLLDEGFSDLPFLVGGHLGPGIVKGAGFGKDGSPSRSLILRTSTSDWSFGSSAVSWFRRSSA